MLWTNRLIIRDHILSEWETEDRKVYTFIIEEIDTKDLVGEVGYAITEDTPQGKVAFLRYSIKKQVWNKGYTEEVIKRMLEYAFKENNVYSVYTIGQKSKHGIKNIMMQLGFTQETEDSEDVINYKLLRNEWEKNTQPYRKRTLKVKTSGGNIGKTSGKAAVMSMG